jgi:hypothetical protein
MRLRMLLVLPLIALVTVLATPAMAQSTGGESSSGDGGLHVSGGGVVGYVGGSGSISGNVRGPGGGSSSRAPTRAPDPGPAAVTDGVVEPAELPIVESPVDATNASSPGPNLLFAAMLGVVVIGIAIFLRRGSKPRLQL